MVAKSTWTCRFWGGILVGILWLLFIWEFGVLMLMIIVLSADDDLANRILVVGSTVGVIMIAFRYLRCRVQITDAEIVVVNPWRRTVTFPNTGTRYAEPGNAWFYDLWGVRGDVLILHDQGVRAKMIATLYMPWEHSKYEELRKRLVEAGVEIRREEPSDDRTAKGG